MAKKLGDRIRELRDERTQAEIADRVGVSQGTIADWESGRSLPRHRKMVRLAKVLGVTPSELLA